MAKRLLVFRPSLADGGADRVTITLLQHLDRTRFRPTLVLNRRDGVLVNEVPHDVPVHELGARRMALALPALTHLLRSEAPDIVFCTAGGANSIVAAAHLAARSQARLVLSERNAVRRPNISPWRLALEVPLKQVMYRRADCVTAVSEGVADDLHQTLHIPRDRVALVYNPIVRPDVMEMGAVPVDHPWVQAATANHSAAPLLVAVGRLVPQKDYPTMLRAMVRIRAAAPARLLILGQGEARADLERLVTQLGLGDAVQFVGFDPNPYRFMSRAACLMQSSVAEGLPGTLVQSMAAGTPVVATDCDFGPREVIVDGITGYLVPVGDATALADRVLRVLSDATARAAMGQSARVRAQRFTVAESMARYQAALDPQ